MARNQRVSEPAVEIPLFPLNTVLFPAGILPLKIFEPRYLDMVGRCLREDRGFGIVAIREGGETGVLASIHQIGTMARIEDWFQLEDGLLGIKAVGAGRFLVEGVSRKGDGLNVGQVKFVEPETEMPVPDRFRSLVLLLENVMAEMTDQFGEVEKHFEDASWVGYRLAEVLPLSLEQRQLCLEISDPIQRLEFINPLLESLSE
jgi:uncharacterized protein